MKNRNTLHILVTLAVLSAPLASFASATDTELINSCTKLAGSSWPDILRETRNNPISLKKLFWEGETKRGPMKPIDQLNKIVNEGNTEIDEKKINLLLAYECSSLAAMNAQRELDEEELELGKREIKKSTKMSQEGAEIKCYNEGFETLDFDACSSAITAYDALNVGEMGLVAVQQIDYQGTAMDAQQKVMEDPSNPTGALEAQKTSIEKQAQIANSQAAYHSTKLATLYGFLNNMPTDASILEGCELVGSRVNSKLHKLIDGYGQEEVGIVAQKLNEIKDSTEPNDVALKEKLTNLSEVFKSFNEVRNGIPGLCEFALDSSTGLQSQGVRFLANSRAQEAIKAAMVQEGKQALVKAGEGMLLNKQAGKIDDAIGNVKEFEPQGIGYDEEDVKATKCYINPNDPECFETGDQEVGFADNSFTIGGGFGGSNTLGDNERKETDGSVADSSSSDPTAQDPVTGIGGLVADAGGKGGFDSAAPSAATVKAGAGGSAGGGGGGSGASGVSAPGGGVGGKRGAMPQRKSKQKAIGYTGGAGSAGYTGGGSSRSKKKGSGNPFDSLFGKKKKGKSGNKVLNFRGVASSQIGGKGGSIFEMISKRYKSVDNSNKLLKYKATIKK